MRRHFLFPLLLFAVPLASQEPPPIQDNSFLIEEAYNQESGVVQHVNAFSRAEGGNWDYGFTQEWSVAGIRHQLGYTLALVDAGAGAGIGDVLVNYRYQLAGNPAARFLLAPRLSLLFPTGSEALGRGTGAFALQVNLPVSVVLAPAFVTHLNAGTTLTPSADAPFGRHVPTLAFNLGGSAVFLARPWLNLLVEAVWFSEEFVTADGTTELSRSAFINPGVRWAFDAGSVQVVPGVAYTIGVGPSRGEDAVFLYLSLEHAFRK